MDWTAPVDQYCERVSPEFWSEPLNAISNFGFLLAAAFGYAALRRHNRRDPALFAMVLLVAAIGVGSFLFHTFANVWSRLADVIPITVFIYAYLALALLRFLKLSSRAVAASLIVFFALSLPVETMLRPLLSGSAGYVPALAAIFVVGGVLAARRHPATARMLGAGVVFLVSLTLRTLDQPLCAVMPTGTHFIWHLLNATTLGMLTLAAIGEPRDTH